MLRKLKGGCLFLLRLLGADGEVWMLLGSWDLCGVCASEPPLAHLLTCQCREQLLAQLPVLPAGLGSAWGILSAFLRQQRAAGQVPAMVIGHLGSWQGYA